MRNRNLLVFLLGTATLAACGQSPTSAATAVAQPRFDSSASPSAGGHGFGSGSAVPTGSTSTSETSVTGDTTSRGGHGFGSGG